MVSINSRLPDTSLQDPQALEGWIDALCLERRDEDAAILRDAFTLSRDYHLSEDPAKGENALRACLMVAETLAEMRLDAETLAAAMIHDILAWPGPSIEEMEARFGPGVARMARQTDMVATFTRLPEESLNRDQSEHLENLRRLLLGLADDIRTILIVLARQVHRMHAIKQASEVIRRAEARDTRDIYAPLANRLGIWQLKWELEDFSLRYLEPDAYKEIASLLDGRRSDRERYINEVMDLLREKYAEAGLRADIMGRPKHIYSIWKKMKRKRVGIDRIFDLRAVRVLVDDITACYTALGIVHGLWRHIPGEFDDYVATPKPNGYRSIHTAVIGPEDKTLEIQIRTHDMHESSELGVAAHWRYKEQGKQDTDFERRIVAMRNWLEMKDEEGEPTDESLIEELKSEYEPRNIYVFTPQGKVIELTQGATALDFAYTIHSEIGHRCRGAKADGHIIQLNQPLANGQMVEIITVKEGGPSRDWISPHLDYLHTSKARNRVRQWFKQQDYDEHLHIGRAALDKEIAKLGADKPDLHKAAERFNFKAPDDLLAAIGRGEVSPVQIASFGEPPRKPEEQRDEPQIRTHRKRRGKRSEPQILVEGIDDLMIHKAKCCQPVPGDEIIGYISHGQGIKVHREDCPMLETLDEEGKARLIDVEWEAPKNSATVLDIHILAHDRRRLLADISGIFSDENIYVIGTRTQSDRKNETASMDFTVEIERLEQLSKVLDKIRQLPDVIKVRRES